MNKYTDLWVILDARQNVFVEYLFPGGITIKTAILHATVIKVSISIAMDQNSVPGPN